MTSPNEPIATSYVEIRPAPDSQTAFKQHLAQATEPAAKGLSDRVQRAVGEGLRGTGNTTAATAVGAAIGTVIGQGISAGVRRGLHAATDVFRTGVTELKDYQAGLAQLQAGLKSTGGVSGQTTAGLEKLARSVQAYSGQTDDSIVRSESFLLTFDKVRDGVGKGSDVFTRATKDTADLAARLGGGDAASKAILLGKALQDPQRGLVGLARAGVTFDDQTRKTIIHLDQTGRSLQAQKLILAEVEKQVGGSARAYGDTLPGKVDRAHRAFEDLSQNLLAQTAPALEDVASATTSVLTAIDKAGPVVPVVLALGGGLLAVTKAVKLYREVRDTLFASTAKTVASNEAVAASYDTVAESATAAAIAERGAAASGGAGGGGLLGGAGRFGLGGLGRAGVIGAAGVGIYGLATEGLFRGDQQATLREGAIARGRGVSFGSSFDSRSFYEDLGHRLGSRTLDRWTGYGADKAAGERVEADKQKAAQAKQAAYLATPVGANSAALIAARTELADPTKRAAEASALGGVFGGAFTTLPARQGDVAGAREAQRRADAQVRAAQDALTAASRGAGGASAGQLAAAQASVLTARDALHRRGGDSQAEALRLQSAEAHLSDLRARGGVNTDKLRAAEERLRAARVTAAHAAATTKTAEDGTALSVTTVLTRLGGQLKNAKGLRDDSKKLINDGISRGVLEELDKLEQSAPGTLDKVAKSLTPAMAKQLNSQYAALQKVQQEFLTAPLRAAVVAAKTEQDHLLAQAAASQAAAYQKALRDAGIDLSGAYAPPDRGQVPRLVGGEPAGGVQTGAGPQPTGLDGFAGQQAGVHLHVHGYGAQQVRHVAATEIGRHDRDTGHLVAGVM